MNMNHQRLWVNQKFEAAELFGFETRNRYQILDEQKNVVGYAAEQRKGFFGFLLRQSVGHWFRFDVHFFNPAREVFLIAHHPFRWFFPRVELKDKNGRVLGAIQHRFSLFTKKFDVENASGTVILEVNSPFLKFWTFGFKRDGQELASVKKKWSGGLSEFFTDRDNFLIEFTHMSLSEDDKKLVLASAIFIDLLYFEQKAD